MNTFKVSVTPTREQNKRKCEEIRIPTIVVLAPFTPKSVVNFLDIPVTKTARRCLKIQNPTDCVKKLLLTKILKPEYNARFSWTNAVIEPNAEIDLEIEWTPMKPFGAMETIQFTDDRGFKKDVSIVLKSVIVKEKGKRIGGGPGVIKPSKPKLKSPSPKKCILAKTITPVGVRRRSYSANSIHVRKFQQTSEVQKIEQIATAQRVTTIDNLFDSIQFNETIDNKENKNPTTPTDASTLFDKIQFTPLADLKSKAANTYENLASRPTPVSVTRAYDNSLKPNNFEIKTRRLMLPSPEHVAHLNSIYSNNTNVAAFETPKIHVRKDFEPEIYSTVTRNMHVIHEMETVSTLVTETRHLYEHELLNVSIKNHTFDYGADEEQKLGENSNSLENLSTKTYVKTSPIGNIPLLSVTQPLSSPHLAIIDEEERCNGGCNERLTKTYNLLESDLDFISPIKTKSNEHLSKTPYIPTPLRKLASLHDVSRDCEKKFLKFAQGSMPNLNGEEAKLIDSIENNRFFRRSPSHREVQRNLDTNIVFAENEICAQSSLFNLNEAVPSNRCRTLSGSNLRERRNSIDKNATVYKPVRMIITPPKHKSERDDHLQSRAQTIRSANWGKTIDKMIKPMHTLVLKRKPSAEPVKPVIPRSGSSSSISSSTSSVYGTPRKNKARRFDDEAGRVPLFDPDLYLQGIINPDPFAATTTCDPFLSSTLYLDQRAVDEHEKQFKKWLNALVTVPDDIETEQKIDLGKLFQDVKNKELKYAPTKEKVSSKYFTKYRMISLRKLAFELYQSNEMKAPLSKLMPMIEKKQLAIRTDRNLHLDLVLQRSILELLLSFNPLWLRIGLEIVFNEEIPMTSNRDVYGLSAFIINRLFRDRYLEAKFAKSFAYSQQYSDQIKASALKYVLILILFMDKAKEKRIIKHNPCLFVRNSKFKETREVLIAFSSSVVANLGDITKYLKRIGYVLTHKQTYLDEFDYAFKNLAIDLRDGVRLTRVMEIILLREGLSRGLRVPAISRLQKLHNVDIALKALAEADFRIMGDITSRDIVEGHREKTLSLLWQIIYKFRAPRFNAAATTIQRWWRHNYLKVFINRRVQQKIEQRRSYAATRIQSMVRSYLSRKRTEKWIIERRTATITIQTCIRRYQCRRRFLLIRNAVRKIQSWYRNQVACRTVRRQFVLKRKSAITIQQWYRRQVLARKLELAAPHIRSLKLQAKLQYEKACLLQRVMKSYVLRKRFRDLVMYIVEYQKLQKDRNRIATRIQSVFRMYIERKRYLTVRNSIIALQNLIRVKQARERFVIIRTSTIIVQNYYRNYLVGKQVRIEYERLKKWTIYIQQKFRANQKMKQARKDYLATIKSCVAIQNRYRANMCMRKIRNDYLLMRSKAILIQRSFRGYQEMKKMQHKFAVLRKAAITIQTVFRSFVLMQKQRAEYLKLRKACICVQSNYRMLVERRKFIRIKNSTLCIQRNWRALIAMRKQRDKYLAIKNSVLLIQCKYRGRVQMKVQKMEFTKIRDSTVVLQHHFKAYIAMKKQREMYILLRTSAITIQLQFRALLAMRHYRQQYLIVRKSTITIQKYFRGYLMMRQIRQEFIQTRTSCIKIQSVLRQITQRKRYQMLRNSTISVQNQWRAMLEMRKTKSEYNRLRNAVIGVQNQFRANKKMRTSRTEYLTLRLVTISIQQRYRGLLLMRQQRTEYELVRASAIHIQRRFRARQAMLSARGKYNKMRNSAIQIQKYFRGYSQMKVDRQNFLNQKSSAVKIQTAYRRFVHHCKYQNLKKAALTIQHRWRAVLAMRLARKKFVHLRRSVILIQRQFRAKQEMLVEHNKYVEIKQAANTLQRRWKAVIAMRQERERYILIRSSTITIQTYVRAVIAMRICRTRYIQIRKSTICIQRYIRGYQLMKRDRESYLNHRNAVIKVQSLYRALIQRRYYLRLQQSVHVVQTRYRTLLAMRRERCTYITIKTSTIIIQKYFRRYLQMRRDQNEFKIQKLAALKIQCRFRGFIARRNYLRLQKSTLVLQHRYRALMAMRKYRIEYLRIKKSVTTIQHFYRNYVISTEIRRNFVTQRNAAVLIQSIYRGYIHRKKYLKIVTSVRIIQTRVRATLEMKKHMSHYQSLKKSTVLIQSQYRAITAMRVERENYLKIRNAVLTIQQRYRAQMLMKYTRNQYLLIRAMVICIQKKFRSQQLMKQDRSHFQQMQNSVRIVQQRFRANCAMRVERERFLKLKNSIVLVQSIYRGVVARLKFRQMWNEMYSPEAIQRRKQEKAALKIQAVWRGYHVRKRQPKKHTDILKKLRKLESGEKKETVKLGLKSSMKLLQGVYNFSVAYQILSRLDKLTRLVPHLFIDDAEFLAEFCYRLMAMAIRSEADKLVIELCSKIMLNLARYENTTNIVFQVNGLVTIAQMLLRWCDKDCGIFNTLCTLIWVFIHDPRKHRQIKKFMTTNESKYTLRETKKLVLRKDNMRKKVKPNKENPIIYAPTELPHFLPDFGVVKGKPYTFVSSVFAFDVVLDKLQIADSI